MTALRMGSLFAGYEGLGLGVSQVLDVELAWVSEIEEAPSRILEHHYPDVPNHGDITAIDWSSVEPIDLLTGGYPCQPFSLAGRRDGTEDERHLWPFAAQAVSALRPSLVVFENVRGHLSLGFDEVLRDLQLLRYEVRWTLLRAADVGAPHGRARIFIVGRNRGAELRGRPGGWRGVHRHPGDRWLDAGAPQGGDDRQGFTDAKSDEGRVRRSPGEGSRLGWSAKGDVRLAAEWPQRVRPHLQDAPAPAGQGRGGGHCAGVPRDGHELLEAAERAGDLDRGDAPEGADLPGTHPGGKSARTRPGPAGAAGPATRGGLSLGSLVGPGQRSVRTGRVHGQVPHVRDDDRWPRFQLGARRSPHGRYRIFVVAWPAADAGGERREWWSRLERDRRQQAERIEAGRDAGDEGRAHAAADSDSYGLEGIGRFRSLGCHPDGRDGAREAAADAGSVAVREQPVAVTGSRSAAESRHAVHWGPYEPAVRRWERALGRVAPPPTEPGRTGERLSPRFVEWMQGLDDGWVTDVPGISRNDQLKALGNGVVPQQAAEAMRQLLAVDEGRWAA